MTQSDAGFAQRQFTESDQQAFARWSGDLNPIHLDAIAARRTQAGARVVHGVHAVLWTLDQLARDVDLRHVSRIQVNFGRFIYLNRPVTIRRTQSSSSALSVEIVSDGNVAIAVKIEFGERKPPSPRHTAIAGAELASLSLTTSDIESLRGVSGRLAETPYAEELAIAFSALANAIGSKRVSGLALLSALVGMECPGLHSIFASFQADLLNDPAPRPEITFQVQLADARFHLIKIAVEGAGIAAIVSAFVRAPPVSGPDMREVGDFVMPNEFSGHNVLVVGGSRGLGSLAARLVAAGAGSVTLTFARGRQDAADVKDDIRAHRGAGECRIARMDVMDDLGAQLQAIEGPITDILYFATPRIARQKSSMFDATLHAEFFYFYVTAFERLVTLLLKRTRYGHIGLLYPSSVAVEESRPGLTEYAMAKAAGEILAADLAAAHPLLKVTIERFGLMRTDQNATLGRAEFEEPVGPLLKALRRTLRGAS